MPFRALALRQSSDSVAIYIINSFDKTNIILLQNKILLFLYIWELRSENRSTPLVTFKQFFIEDFSF